MIVIYLKSVFNGFQLIKHSLGYIYLPEMFNCKLCNLYHYARRERISTIIISREIEHKIDHILWFNNDTYFLK